MNKITEDVMKKINDMLSDDEDVNTEYSNKWIEYQAAYHIITSLHEYNGIFDASGITVRDKGLSYDGRVEVYEKGKENGRSFLGYIDVQIKGTCVDSIKNGNSKYEIEVKHLVNYVKSQVGALLFVVQIEKETKNKKIFYRFLLPSDLKRIFNTIDEGQEHKTIDIYPIDSKQKTYLKNICLQYLKAKNMQIGKTVITINPNEDFPKIFIQDFRNNENEFLKDKFYLYIKKDEEQGLIPAILPDGSKIGSVNVINEPVIINGKKFFEKYEVIVGENELIYKFGNSIEFNMRTHTMNFTFKGSLSSRINDMEFALEIINLTGKNRKDAQKIKNSIEILKKFKTNMENLKINIACNLETFSAKDYDSMDFINKLMDNDKTANSLVKSTGLYYVDIQGRKVVLFIHKEKGKINVYNFFGENIKKYRFAEFINGKYEIISPYILLPDNLNFENIINFDSKSVKESINITENRDESRELLNELMLAFIKSYDNTDNEEFYLLAELIGNRLKELYPSNDLFAINRYQLIRRKRLFNDDERKNIYEIKSKNGDTSILYGISILLENKSDVDYYYTQMPEEEKTFVNNTPIEFLKRKLIK